MARGKASGRYTPRRSGGDEDDGGPDWMGTYGDMITLLMAFFVMLYAMSSVDAEKFKQFVSGLAAPFGNEAAVGLLDGGPSLETNGTTATDDVAAELQDLVAIPPITNEPVTPIRPEPTEEPDPPVDEESSEPPHQAIEIAEALRAALAAEGLPTDIAEVRPDERGVVISVASDDVLFPLGSASVSPLGKRIVKAVATIVDDLPNEVIVEGHTDNLPLRRQGYDNWNLSTDRAVAVLQLLRDNDVDPRRLIATGFGEYRPRVANDSDEHRALNRRVDVVLVSEQGDL